MTAMNEVAVEDHNFGFGADIAVVPIPAPGEQLTQPAAPVEAEKVEDAAKVEVAPAPPPPVKRLTCKERLLLLANPKNTAYPMQIDGPNGEKYVSAHMLRAVALGAQQEMGWCDAGVNHAISFFGMPRVRRDENTGILRRFNCTVRIIDRPGSAYERARPLGTSEQVRRSIQTGFNHYNRQADQPWAIEYGDIETTTRKSVVFDGDGVTVLSEETTTTRGMNIKVTGWYQAATPTGEPSDADKEKVGQRVAQMICYHNDFKIEGTERRYIDGLKNLTIEDSPIDADEMFSDNELLDALTTVLGGRLSLLRGHG